MQNVIQSAANGWQQQAQSVQRGHRTYATVSKISPSHQPPPSIPPRPDRNVSAPHSLPMLVGVMWVLEDESGFGCAGERGGRWVGAGARG